MAELLKPGSLVVTAGGFALVANTDYPEDESTMTARDAGASVAGVRQDWAKVYGRGQRATSVTWSCRRKFSSWEAGMAAKVAIMTGYPRGSVDVTETFGSALTKFIGARVSGCTIRQSGLWLFLTWTIEGGEIAAS